MRTQISLLSLLLLTLALGGRLSAQSEQDEDEGGWPQWQAGFVGSSVVAITEANQVNPTVGLRAMIRYSLSRSLRAERGGGFAHYVDKHSVPKLLDVEGDAFPVDFRLLIAPVQGSWFTPYVYFGFGITSYNADFPGTYLSPFNDHGPLEGLYPHIPLGAGVMVETGIPLLAIDLNAGIDFGLTDNLNPNRDGQIDNLLLFSIGPTFSFGYVRAPEMLDEDEDGLSDLDEELNGTDPKVADSDGDGLNDGMEVNILKTDPLVVDSDNDQLSDIEEVEIYRTDPIKPDSDGDGYDDGVEVLTHQTNPRKIDSDGDGLSDWDEIETYRCNPNNVDSDLDGVTDGAEVQVHRTNPTLKDTDRDKLSDGDEISIHRTDPLKLDTDGGGVGDGDEVENGGDPLDPADG